MTQPNNQNQQAENGQIQVKITDEVLKGVYSNMAQVAHTPTGEEFVIDFMSILGMSGIVNARVILSPGHFKRVVEAMSENLKNYEKTFGQIKPSESPKQHIGFRTE